MADNTTLNSMTGGDVIATDEIGGVKHQRVKVQFGADGIATDASSANPLPVATTQTITLSDSTTTPLAGGATWTSTAMDTSIYGGFLTALTTTDVAGTHVVEESLDGATWTVVHTASIVPSEPHTDAFTIHARYVRTRLVNGASAQSSLISMVMLRQTGAVDTVFIDERGNIVKGDLTENTAPPGDGQAFDVVPAIATASARSLSEGNLSKLRTTLAGDLVATLDGETITVSATNLDIRDLTDASDSVTATPPADQSVTDTITALNDSVVFTVTAGRTTGAFQVTGTWTGTLTFQRNLDSTNWETMPVSTGTDVVTTTTTNGIFVFPIAAATQIRVTATAWTSGTATVTATRSVGTQTVRLASALPTGTNSIGTVTASNTTGNVAHDVTDSGNPVKVGGVGRSTNITPVADTDRVDATFDLEGRQIVTLHGPHALTVHQTTTISTTSETTVLTAGAANIFHDLISIVAINTSATATRVDFRDSTTGTIRLALYLPAGDTRGISVNVPIIQAAAANNWTAQLGTAVTDVRIFVLAVKKRG